VPLKATTDFGIKFNLINYNTLNNNQVTLKRLSMLSFQPI